MDLSYCCVGAFSYTDTRVWDDRMGTQPGCIYYFHYCDGKRSRWCRCCTNGLRSYCFPIYVCYWSRDIGTFFIASTEAFPLLDLKIPYANTIYCLSPIHRKKNILAIAVKYLLMRRAKIKIVKEYIWY
jgi:hypothetical protein